MATRRITRRSIETAPQQAGRTTQIARRTSTHPDPTATDVAKALMEAALGFQKIDVVVPETAKLIDVEKYLRVAVNGLGDLRKAAERIRPFIGRLLIVIQERNLFKPDFPNFTDYLNKRVQDEWGYARTLATDCIKQVRAFPTVDVTKYNSTVLTLAAGITDETHPDYIDTLDKLARAKNIPAARELARQLRNPSATPGDSVVLSIRCPEALRTRYNELCEELSCHGYELLQQALDALEATLPADVAETVHA